MSKEPRVQPVLCSVLQPPEPLWGKWAVDKDSLDFVAENYVVDKDRSQLGEKELVGSGDLDEYNKKSAEQLTKLKYRKNLREEYKSFVEEEIIPLMVR